MGVFWVYAMKQATAREYVMKVGVLKRGEEWKCNKGKITE